jgi:hypothetical protein
VFSGNCKNDTEHGRRFSFDVEIEEIGTYIERKILYCGLEISLLHVPLDTALLQLGSPVGHVDPRSGSALGTPC